MNKLKKKAEARKRRKFRIRTRLMGTAEKPRLSVFRSDKYTYVQVVSDETGKTLVSASTKDANVAGRASSIEDPREGASVSPKSVRAAKGLGMVVAEKCIEKGIKNLVFDRNGFLYHGRVKAIADGLREGGLQV